MLNRRLGLAQPLPSRAMSTQARLTLFQTLSALPAPQFEQLRFALNPSPVMGDYGTYALADPLLQQALDLHQKLIGDEHEDIAARLDRAARSHELQERYSEAKPLYLQALELHQQLLSNEHPDMALTLNNLAAL